MYTLRSLDGSPEDVFYPYFRPVNFSDEGAILLVSTHLRHAWTAAPGTDVGAGAVGAFIAASHNHTEEERSAVPQYPNKDEVHTPWRDEIYHQWNHVFYDVANFLYSVGPGIGRLHPPAHEAFALNYPVAGREGEGEGKVWDYNVLIIPAYLEQGVKVRMSTFDRVAGEEKTLGTFDGSNTAEIWFLMKDSNVRFFVEGEYEDVRGGVAAVMVIGRLDTTSPGHENVNQEASNAGETSGADDDDEADEDEDGNDVDDDGEDEEEDEDETEEDDDDDEEETEDEADDEVVHSQPPSATFPNYINGSYQ